MFLVLLIKILQPWFFFWYELSQDKVLLLVKQKWQFTSQGEGLKYSCSDGVTPKPPLQNPTDVLKKNNK